MGHWMLACSALLCLLDLSYGRFVMQRDFLSLINDKGEVKNCG